MQKRIPTTVVYVAVVDDKLNVEEKDPIIFVGRLTEKQVRWRIEKSHPSYSITKVEHQEKLYGMRITDFMKYGYIKEEDINHG